jgi:hypothetical protein
MPIITDVLKVLMPIITDIINALLPALMTVLNALMPIIKVVAYLFSAQLGAAMNAIKPIIDGIMKYLKGFIEFITGVFSGDWKKAWEGIKNIFGGIWDTLVAVFKAPFRAIVGVINKVIEGLNKLKIPDWVPGLGGKGIDIPPIGIDGFAKGSLNTPDTFIAGEKGAELVTNAKGRTVFTAMQTQRILDNYNRAREAQTSYSPNVEAPRLTSANYNTNTRNSTPVSINYSPTIHVSGDKPNDLEVKLKQHDDIFMRKITAMFENMEKDRLRTAYD